MTVKLLLLKSGEDVIADVSEMAVGEDADRKVLGYFLLLTSRLSDTI